VGPGAGGSEGGPLSALTFFSRLSLLRRPRISATVTEDRVSPHASSTSTALPIDDTDRQDLTALELTKTENGERTVRDEFWCCLLVTAFSGLY
jgi:hypothetical protein